MGHIAFVRTALDGVPSYRACVGAVKKNKIKTVKKIEETRNCWFKAAKCPLSSMWIKYMKWWPQYQAVKTPLWVLNCSIHRCENKLNDGIRPDICFM